MDKHHPCNTINKTVIMSALHSPCSKVTLSSPKSPPATLLQVRVSRPWFNGHKPFIEGEGQLNNAAISDTDMKSVIKHSPSEPETVAEQSQANGIREWFQRTICGFGGPSSLWTCTEREPFCGAQREAIDGPGAEIRYSACDMNIVNKKNEKSVLRHSLKPGTAPMPFALEPQHHRRLPLPPLIPPHESLDPTKRA
jgi:hypothetical protein